MIWRWVIYFSLTVGLASAASVTGEVELTNSKNIGVRRHKDYAGVVIWLEPIDRPLPAMPPRKVEMQQKDKQFVPHVVAISLGSTVEMPNLDMIFHNAFSLSEKARFDLGLYRNGASKPWTFENPGLVRIYCNIHPQMAAFVLVVDGTTYGQAGADGIVVLSGVPPGRRTVKVWDERGDEWTGAADVLPGRTASLSVMLDASKWREVPHRNKYGKEYPPPDDDENRY